MNQEINKKEEYLLKKERKEREYFNRIKKNKIKKFAFLFLSIVFFASVIFIIMSNSSEKFRDNADLEKQKITFFYSPTCSCCKEYLPYLKRNGFNVEAEETRDMLSIKEEYQISREMESCHTSIIGDYFVEGHVPAEAIKKLLEEKPEISGIALPGMPQGSPGMPGFKIGKWTIYGLSNGESFEFMSL